MEVLRLVVSVTSISSVPVCVTLTTRPEARDTYSKLCADPFHFPADCTPFLRSSGGVGSRAALERTKFKFARITAQSVGGCDFAAESAAPAVVGTSGFGGWQDSLRRYCEPVRQTIPAMGNESAGCSDDQVCPTEKPPGGAPALELICAIHSRADCAAFSESTIPSRPETDITFPPASSVNSTTLPSSFLYCSVVAAAAGSNVSLRTVAVDFSYVVRSRIPPGAPASAGKTSMRTVAFQLTTRLDGPCGSEARPDRGVSVVLFNFLSQ